MQEAIELFIKLLPLLIFVIGVMLCIEIMYWTIKGYLFRRNRRVRSTECQHSDYYETRR